MRPALLAVALLCAASASAAAAEELRLEVGDAVVQKDVRRFGVNLGKQTPWGASQLLSNLVPNPGFEGRIDRALVVVERAGGYTFSDDAAWVGRGDGFWDGAEYDVRSGASAGRKGRIARSRKSGAGGLPEYDAEGTLPPLSRGDVVALTKTDDDSLPERWHIADEVRLWSAARPHPRPGSPGRRSLELRARRGADVAVRSYFDSIGERAGKMLRLEGKWRLSFWSRRTRPGADLTVSFRRLSGGEFVRRRVELDAEWRRTVVDFEPQDFGKPASLELSFSVDGDGGAVELDDVVLASAGDRSPFRAEVVEVLRRLRPAYLRDWQYQLADTLENRLAPPEARRTTRYEPGVGGDHEYAYSLPEFLSLCRLARASPWIVVPTTFSDEELTGLGRYLAESSRESPFPELILEFGNENWNGIFRAAGIASPDAHGPAAERAFAMIRHGAGTLPMTFVVNGQFANPDLARRYARSSPSAQGLAVAPYFAFGLDAGVTAAARTAALFEPDGGRLRSIQEDLRPRGQELLVAEVNMHTTKGRGSPEEHDALTGGTPAGAALAFRMLEALRGGARRQCAYVLAQYDMRLAERDGYVRLWGLARDLGPTMSLRATGAALAMMNAALRGDLVTTTPPPEADPHGVAGYAFRSGKGWSAVLLSRSPAARRVRVVFPAPPGPLEQLTLRGSGLEPDDDTRDPVRVVSSDASVAGREAVVDLEPYGLAVLTDAAGGGG